jgi:putative FmdB family regulatory protein
MPLYEYECFVCGHRFERIQRFSDPPASECPACGGSVRRLLGVPALQFKGSGFYITDYARGSAAGPKARVKDSQKADKPDKSDKPVPVPKTESTAAKPADSKT